MKLITNFQRIAYEISTMALDEKLRKSRENLGLHLLAYFRKNDFPYRESFYVQKSVDDVKAEIDNIQKEFKEEESKVLLPPLIQHLEKLTKWQDDWYQHDTALEDFDIALKSLKPELPSSYLTDDENLSRKLMKVWIFMLADRNVTEIFPLLSEEDKRLVSLSVQPVHNGYRSLTGRCFSLSIFLGQYTFKQIEALWQLDNLLDTLLHSNKEKDWWLLNAPLLGIILLHNRSCIEYLKCRIPKLGNQLTEFCQKKNIHLKDMTSEQICELFYLEEAKFMFPRKPLFDTLEPHLLRDCINIVSEYYGNNASFFKPCAKPIYEPASTQSENAPAHGGS